MSKQKKHFFKMSVSYLLGDIFVKGLSVLTTPIFTRMLSMEEYGEFSNFISWESILFVIATLDLSNSVTRAKYDFKDEIDEFLSSIVAMSNIATIVLYLLIELNYSYIENIISMDIEYIRILFVYFMFEPAYSYMQIKHRMYMKYKFFLAFSLVSAILRMGVSVLLVYFMDNKLDGRIYGYIIPVMVMYIGIYVYVWIKGHAVKWKYIKFALAIGIPMIPSALSVNLLQSSDRVMINSYCGADKTAIYSVGYTVSMMVTLIRQSLNKVWSPWFMDKMNEGRYDIIKKYANYYTTFFSLLIFGGMLIAPEMVLALGGRGYEKANVVIPPIMGGLLCQFIYTIYFYVEIYNKKTFSISIGTLLAATVNVLLNRLFIPQFGFQAAAYTTYIGYLCMALFHYFNVKYILKKGDLFNNRWFIILIGIFFALQVLCDYLYTNLFLRMVTILVYFFVLIFVIYKNRNYLREFIK